MSRRLRHLSRVPRRDLHPLETNNEKRTVMHPFRRDAGQAAVGLEP